MSGKMSIGGVKLSDENIDNRRGGVCWFSLMQEIIGSK